MPDRQPDETAKRAVPPPGRLVDACSPSSAIGALHVRMNGEHTSRRPSIGTQKEPGLPLSQAIGVARLICILGIVYVHAWTGIGGEQMSRLAESAQGITRWSVVELFGRASVPLLTMISGWLVAASIGRRGTPSFVAGKARAVLAPMLLWNAIGIVVVMSASRAGWVVGPVRGDFMFFANNLLSVTRGADINVQMTFLRDLFLCMLAAPLLVRLSSRWLILLIAATTLWVIVGWQLYLLLRPSILIFFIAGLLARRHHLAEAAARLAPWQAALPFLLIGPLKIALSVAMDGRGGLDLHVLAAVDLVTRAAVALLVWRLAIGLARRPLGEQLLGLERYAFFLFCSHLLFMWLVAPQLGQITGSMGHPAWLGLFLVMPPLALVFAIVLAKAVETLSPTAADLLSGGRLGRDQIASPAARPLAQAH